MIEFLALNGAWLSMPNDYRLARLFLLMLAKRMTQAKFADLLYDYIRLY